MHRESSIHDCIVIVDSTKTLTWLSWPVAHPHPWLELNREKDITIYTNQPELIRCSFMMNLVEAFHLKWNQSEPRMGI